MRRKPPLLLPFVIVFGLFCTTYVIGNTDIQEKQNPAADLNKPDSRQQKNSKSDNSAPSQSRGQLLYEHHCLKCHESNIHIRNKRKAQTISDIQSWVMKWQAHEKLNWTEIEINAVTHHLLNRYYKFK